MTAFVHLPPFQSRQSPAFVSVIGGVAAALPCERRGSC